MSGKTIVVNPEMTAGTVEEGYGEVTLTCLAAMSTFRGFVLGNRILPAPLNHARAIGADLRDHARTSALMFGNAGVLLETGAPVISVPRCPVWLAWWDMGWDSSSLRSGPL